jgi:hypothetical protein
MEKYLIFIGCQCKIILHTHNIPIKLIFFITDIKLMFYFYISTTKINKKRKFKERSDQG